MFVRSLKFTPRRPRRHARPGAVLGWFILLLPVLVLCFALAVHVASLYARRLELQNSADAAALAGLNHSVPVNDIELFGAAPVPAVNRNIILDHMRDAAVNYARRNPFGGADPQLNFNPTNNPSGELVIGTMNDPNGATPPGRSTDLTRTWSLYSPFPPGGAAYNTVDVSMVRKAVGVLGPQDVSVWTRAYLDRDVIGFKVEGSSHTDNLSPLISLTGTVPAIPIVPIAIRTDYATNPPTDQDSWDYQIIFRHGDDNYSIASGTPTAGSDGIPEIEVLISAAANNGQDNGKVLAVGKINGNNPTWADALTQIQTGVTWQQLNNATYNGQLTLNDGTQAQNQIFLTQLQPTDAQRDSLKDALLAIKGQRRIWMLYNDAGGAQVQVVGFVVARVMDAIVGKIQEGPPPHPACPPPSNDPKCKNRVAVVLQPSMLITCDAITDFSKRALGPRKVFGVNSIYNPYVAKARVVR